MKNKKTALYRFFNSEGDLLYIGVSLSAVYRLSQHKIKPWYLEISWIDIQWFPSRKIALLAEAEAIKSEFPRFNMMHAKNSINNNKIGWRYADKKINQEGKLVVKFKEEMIPYIGNPFSRCRIVIFDKIKSKRAALLMSIFMSRSWENKVCEIGIYTIRSMFNLGDKYPEFSNIKQKIIDPMVKTINSCSNINVQHSFIKKGRKVTAIHFQFDFKPELEIAS
jgi:hypothetical protein